MRKGIWQEFDGYQEIVEEIKVSRKLGGTVNAADMPAEEYIRRLHPDKLELWVAEIVEETPSTKTLRFAWYPEITICPRFRPASMLPFTLKWTASGRADRTVYLRSPIRPVITTLPSGGLKTDWFRTICSMKSSGEML